MNLADKIQKLRKEQGFSQETFAEKLGVSRQSVSKWESGSALPDTEKIILISELFGVSTDYLLKNSEPQDADDKKNDVSDDTDNDDRDTVKEKKKITKKQLVIIIIAAVIVLSIIIAAIIIPFKKRGTAGEQQEEINNGGAKYPYVLVHGLGGWGDGDGINASVQYWGATAGDLETVLTEKGYTVYTPSVGPMSSAWDRVCELYAQLTGTTVDYGEAHSKEHNHSRYGRVYETPVIADWGVNKKINLVGHSFGGATVRLLTSLLEYGSEAEKTISGENVSPLFEGGKGKWINSVTTLCAPHNGSSLTEIINTAGEFLGYESTTDWLIDLCLSLSNVTSESINDIYDFKLEHFNIDENSENPLKVVMEMGNDHAAYDLSPDGAAELNKTIKTVDNVYYFSYYYNTTEKSDIIGGYLPDKGTNPILMLPAGLIGKYTGTTTGGIEINETWQPNDGLVSVVSAKYPFGEKFVDMPEDTSKIQKGIWNVATEKRGDHGTVIGLNADSQITFDFYIYLFSIIDSLN